jgi:hypothetical protein
MANFEGCTPYSIERFTSLFEQDDVTVAPLGVAAVCRNSRFHLTGVDTRYGINQKVGNGWFGLNLGTGFPVTGAYSFKYSGNGVAPDKQVPLVYDQNGNLKIESPAGSGVMVPVTSAQVPLPAGYLQATQTLNRGYLTFTDLLKSLGLPAVYDLNTGLLDPASIKPFGVTWAPNTVYGVGDVVTPQGAAGNGHTYRCSVGGVSGENQPAFPLGEGATVVDNTVTWTETTPVLAQTLQLVIQGVPTVTHNAGVGTFAAGRDVYIAVTLVNGNGESVLGGIFSFLNTVLNDRFVVTSPVLPTWVQQLAGAAAVTGYNVYEADVAHGNAAPGTAAFKKVNVGLIAIGVNQNVDTSGAGAAPPVGDSSFIVPLGNICAGLRYAVVLFLTRTGYITGMTQAAVVAYNPNLSPGAGLQLYMAHISTGPPNTASRIVAFTTADNANTVGPFAYIPAQDSVNGVIMTATQINDNTTTSATFNFTDDYLRKQMNTTKNVTAYFDKIQVPPCSNVYFSPTLNSMIWMPDILPSGFFISPSRDPETIFGSTGLLQVAETDGQKRMGWLDYRGIQYVLKEASGHEVTPNSSNPSQWTPRLRWSGVGPCGIRAYGAGKNFIGFVAGPGGDRKGAWASGIYIWDGSEPPKRITKEIPITWARVNWAAKQTIWMFIDDESHEVLVGLPLDRATVPSHVLSCNFEEDLAMNPPIHSTIYSRGKFISSAAARKWSLQDIAANSCIRTQRTVLNPPAQFDSVTVQSQLWYASSYDSAIRAMTPGVFSDDGNLLAIPWVYETVCPGDALKLCRLGGVQALLSGYGAIGVSVLAGSVKSTQDGGVNNRATEIRLKDAIVRPGLTTDYKCQGHGINERYRVRFSTIGKPAGTWGSIKSCTLFLNPVFQARAN